MTRTDSPLHWDGMTVASFQEIGYRPVFSDLLDTDVVYGQGTQIQFGNARLRYYPSDNKLVLQELSIIDIESISPRDDFFKPLSWKVSTGWVRRLRTNGDESAVYRLNTGPGIAFLHNWIGLYYAFAEPEMNISGGLDDSYSLGYGFFSRNFEECDAIMEVPPFCQKDLL